MLGLGLSLSRCSLSEGGGADFSFAKIGGTGTFAAFDAPEDKIAAPKDLGGGSYSTTDYDVVTDYAELVTASGGGKYIGIVDGVPTEFSSGTHHFDLVGGKKVLKGGPAITRLEELDLDDYAKSSLVPTSAPDWGVLKVYDGVATSTGQSRWQKTGVSFTSGQAYALRCLVDVSESDSESFLLRFSDGTNVFTAEWDVSGSAPGSPTISAGSWTNTSADSFSLGDGWYVLWIIGTAANTGTGHIRIYPAFSSNSQMARVSSPQRTATNYVPGMVGGNQSASDTAPAIRYTWSSRLTSAVESLGTSALTVAIEYVTDGAWDAANCLLDYGPLLQSSASGNPAFNEGADTVTANSAASSGVHTATFRDSSGATASFDGATTQTAGTGAFDKNALVTGDTGLLNDGAGANHARAGISRITFVATDATPFDMETQFNDSITWVVPMMGQSNMIGRPTFDSGASHPTGTKQYNQSDSIVDATIPLDHIGETAGDMGLDVQFAIDFIAARPNDTIVFVPLAQGGTGFVDNEWNPPSDTRYAHAVAQINEVFTANPEYTLLGFMWHQGEADSGNASFETQLDAMISAIRSDVTVASSFTPFVLGSFSDGYVGSNTDRIAMRNVVEDTPNRENFTAVAAADDLTVFDGTHFDAASLRTLGSRYYSALATARANT